MKQVTRNKNGRPRDNQKSRVYRSEKDTYRDWAQIFVSSDQVAEYIRYIVNDEKVMKRYGILGHANFKFTNARLRYATHRYVTDNRLGRIHQFKFPRWSWTRPMIIHELAHGYTFNIHGWSEVEGHGPEFCRLYLELVEHFMGEGWAKILANRFADNKVKVKGITWYNR